MVVSAPRCGRFLSAVVAIVVAAYVLAAPSPAGAKEPLSYAPLMLVLDASGSMNQTDAGNGASRIDAAKQATNSMIDQLPSAARVGLAVYGTQTGSSDAEKAAGCSDVKVTNPVAKVDTAALKNTVVGVQARGYTPIGYSLQKAAEQLPSKGPRSIVLVSDGEDTCAPPPPCDVAKQLAQQGVDMRIHTIGFQVDQAARDQLSCIAQATGGNYYDANNGDALRGVLPRVAQRALRDYQPRGKPIHGSAHAHDAPALRPGQYLDTIGSPDQQYYAVTVPHGSTAYFTATEIFSRNSDSETSNIRVRSLSPTGKECDTNTEVSAPENDPEVDSATEKVPLSGGQVPDPSCKTSGKFVFQLGRERGDPQRRPVEIQVYIEPPIKGSAGPPQDPREIPFRDPGGSTTPAVGGSSFADATELTRSGRYTDTLRYGELTFYRVNLAWGQSLAYRVTFTGNGIDSATNIDTHLYVPTRQGYSFQTTAYLGDDNTLGPLETPRALYKNRLQRGTPAQLVSLHGNYYIAVKLGVPVNAVDAPVDNTVSVEIDVSIGGHKISQPTYQQLAGLAAPQSTTAQQSDGTNHSSTVWVVAIGGGLVLVAAVVATVITRRRLRRGQGYSSQP